MTTSHSNQTPTLRHLARQTAVQILYANEPSRVQGAALTERTLEHAHAFGMPRDQEGYVLQLVRGVDSHLQDLDAQITAHLKGWTFERLGLLERSILRVAAFELLHSPELPQAVVINEALELAKTFCEPESIALLNGVLEAIGKSIPVTGIPLPETKKAV